MCQGVSATTGKKCKNPTEPYCRFHVPRPGEKTLFEKKFDKGPPKSDGPGYIYVYYVESDEPDTFYKIGESVDPLFRVEKQWKGILKKRYYVRSRKFAEALVHLELSEMRVYRYKIAIPAAGEDGNFVHLKSDETEDFPITESKYASHICSIYRSTRQPVSPTDESLMIHLTKKTPKSIEWFRVDWATIAPKISKIVNLVNDRKGFA